jgi:hypothetical protein
MISDELMKYVNKATQIDHRLIEEITDEELQSDCLILVAVVPFKNQEYYVKRIKTQEGNWYISEMTDIEYIQWVAIVQAQMLNKAKQISKFTEGLDYESLIEKAQAQIDKEEALKKEKEKLPEEDLIDEDDFKKMWGE